MNLAGTEPSHPVEQRLRRRPTPAQLTERFGSHADATTAYEAAQTDLGRAQGELLKSALRVTGPFGRRKLLQASATYDKANNAALDAGVARHATAVAEGIDPASLHDTGPGARRRGREEALGGSPLDDRMTSRLRVRAADHQGTSSTRYGSAESRHRDLAIAYANALDVVRDEESPHH